MTKQNAYTREDLLRCARGELFGPGNAQLPAPNMLMVDRITHISDTGGKYGKGEMVAELDINPDLWFFTCHFEGDPVIVITSYSIHYTKLYDLMPANVDHSICTKTLMRD